MNVDQTILSDLECSVCINLMHPPIRMCMRGHSFCNLCARRLTTCPVCRGMIGMARNHTLERIHHKLLLPCKNSEECTFRVPGNQLQQHEKFCLYSEKGCFLRSMNGCKWRGAIKDFVGHFQEDHPHNVVQASQQKFLWEDFLAKTTTRKIQQFCTVLEAHGKLFKCVWDINLEKNFVRWYVMCMGPKEEAVDYQYSIVVLNGRNNSEVMHMQGTCQAYETRMFQYGSFHINHVESLNKFCCEEGHLNFMVWIRKSGENEVLRQEEGCMVPVPSTYVDSMDPALEGIRGTLMIMGEYVSASISGDESEYEGQDNHVYNNY